MEYCRREFMSKKDKKLWKKGKGKTKRKDNNHMRDNKVATREGKC